MKLLKQAFFILGFFLFSYGQLQSQITQDWNVLYRNSQLSESLPYHESFESGLGAWTQSADDAFDWTRHTGFTPSPFTGPAGASHGSYYLYTEATTNYPYKVTTLLSPVINLTGSANAYFEFDYCMKVFNGGSIYLDIESPSGSGSWTPIYTKEVSSSTDGTWYTATLGLAAFSGNSVRFRIRGKTGTWGGSDSYSDVAIDNIYIYDLPNSAVLPYQESFDTGLGSWFQAGDDDTDWTRHTGSTPTTNTGPSSASHGTHYLYLEPDPVYFPNSYANLLSPRFDLSGMNFARLTFDYHLFGSEMGLLSLEGDAGLGVWTTIWKSDTVLQDDNWHTTSVDISGYCHDLDRFRFKGKTGIGNLSDMAIDRVRIEEVFNTITVTSNYSESFETGVGNWIQDNSDDYDWTWFSGSTPTNNTGPASANHGTYYFYTESSRPNPGVIVANLLSPVFNLSGLSGARFDFNSHMYSDYGHSGVFMGDLRLKVNENPLSGGTWTTIWERFATPEQTNDWHDVSIDISAYADDQVRFMFESTLDNNNGLSDMALDNLWIFSGNHRSTVTLPYSESFESGLGHWQQYAADDMNWARHSGAVPDVANTGPAVASAGSYYMYTEATGNNNKVAILEGPVVDLSTASAALFEFDYHMNGSHMGALYAQYYADSLSEWIDFWSVEGSQGSGWISATADITYLRGKLVPVRFKAKTGPGNYSDIAIDNISITESCGGNVVTLKLKLDPFPDEVRWYIKDSNGNVLQSGGGYHPMRAGQVLTFSYCLPDGDYEFYMTDNLGMGSPDGWMNGYWKIVDECGTEIMRRDAFMFGAWITEPFSLPLQGPGGVTCNLSAWLRADKMVYSDKLDSLAGSTTADSGNTVQSWGDYSGIMNNAATNYNGLDAPVFYNNPTYNVNFNPVLFFDGSDALDFYDDFLFSSGNGLTMLAVSWPDAASTGADKFVLDFGSYPLAGYGLMASRQTASVYGGGQVNVPPSFSSVPFIQRGRMQFGDQLDLHINGAFKGNVSTLQSSFNAASIAEQNTHAPEAGPLTIGRQSKTNDEAGRAFHGRLAELIVFSSAVPENELRKVETYLALKYGLTLDNSVGGESGDYIASDGTLLWDANVNSTYHYNVAGIGRDDAAGLDQRQSRSVNAGGFLTIALNDIAASNSHNVNQFDNDKSYLVWGGTNAWPSFGVPFGTEFGRNARIWHMRETGNVGEVKVAIDASAVTFTGCQRLYMVVSSDADVAPGDQLVLMGQEGDYYTCRYDFGAESYISFVISESHCEIILPAEDILIDDYCNRANGSWSYYYDPADEDDLLFALEKNPAGGNTNAIMASILLKTTSAPSSEGGFYKHEDTENKNATFTIGRSWNVELTSGSINGAGVNVRFYFDPADTLAAWNAAQAFKAENGGAQLQVSKLRWFKTIGEAYNPANLDVTGYSGEPIGEGNTVELDFTYGTELGRSYAQFRNITSFSGGSAMYVASFNSTLPIRLLSFTAVQHEKQVKLDWVTSEEKNTEKFLIERSSDGRSWVTIGQLAAHGFSNTRKEYTLTDSRPQFGRNYYRLKSVDFDGQYEYSPQRLVEFGRHIVDIQLYPNPARGWFHVTATHETVRFELFNALGQAERLQAVQEGDRYMFEVPHLPKGMYFLRVCTPEHEQHFKLILD